MGMCQSYFGASTSGQGLTAPQFAACIRAVAHTSATSEAAKSQQKQKQQQQQSNNNNNNNNNLATNVHHTPAEADNNNNNNNSDNNNNNNKKTTCDYVNFSKTEVSQVECENEKFSITSFADSAFLRIRELEGISHDFFESEWVLPEDHVGLRETEGRSRAMFLVSNHRCMLCKTVSEGEVNTLLQMLPDLVHHFETKPNSLLQRFLLAIRIENVGTKEIGWIVVFTDIFAKCPIIHEKWDLKGRQPKSSKYLFLPPQSLVVASSDSSSDVDSTASATAATTSASQSKTNTSSASTNSHHEGKNKTSSSASDGTLEITMSGVPSAQERKQHANLEENRPTELKPIDLLSGENGEGVDEGEGIEEEEKEDFGQQLDSASFDAATAVLPSEGNIDQDVLEADHDKPLMRTYGDHYARVIARKDKELTRVFFVSGEAALKDIQQTIRDDAEFLGQQGVLDYSILIGVKYVDPKSQFRAMRYNQLYAPNAHKKFLDPESYSDEDDDEDDDNNNNEKNQNSKKKNKKKKDDKKKQAKKRDKSRFVPPALKKEEEEELECEVRDTCSGVKFTAASKFHRGFYSAGRLEVYYVGIIDMLTSYTVMKKSANFFKNCLWNDDTLSTIPPESYKDRFVSFFEKAIVRGPSSIQIVDKEATCVAIASPRRSKSSPNNNNNNNENTKEEASEEKKKL